MYQDNEALQSRNPRLGKRCKLGAFTDLEEVAQRCFRKPLRAKEEKSEFRPHPIQGIETPKVCTLRVVNQK